MDVRELTRLAELVVAVAPTVVMVVVGVGRIVLKIAIILVVQGVWAVQMVVRVVVRIALIIVTEIALIVG